MPDLPHKEVTIYDLARELNLSAATISRALQNNPSVSKKTRKRIQDLAQAAGYRSNQFARNLRQGNTNTIGVIVPKLNSYFMSAVIAGMESVASKAGYNLLISQSNESVKKEKVNVATMFASRVDGLLVSCAYDTRNSQHFEVFVKQKVPVVFFDRAIDTEHFSTVSIDNRKAAREATQHLLSQGCHNVVHVTTASRLGVYSDRMMGYRDALEEMGLAFDEAGIIYGDLSYEAGRNAAQTILQMERQPDGVFVANDNCAVSCMVALKEAGVQIPQDIAFAGFNNDPVARIIEPHLTTINYPGYEMGEIAVRHLLDELNATTGTIKLDKIILRSDLIVRESSQRISYFAEDIKGR